MILRRMPRPATPPQLRESPPGIPGSPSYASWSPSRSVPNVTELYTNSDIFERERLRQPGVVQWHERLATHEPARRRHEAPADRREGGDVQRGHADAFRMQRRHHLP